MRIVRYLLGSGILLLFWFLQACAAPPNRDVNVVNTPDVTVVNPVSTVSHLGVKPSRFLTLTGADCPGVDDEGVLGVLNSGEDFFVPEGMNFVLTDIVVSPQNVGLEGIFVFQVLSSLPFSTALNTQASIDDFSSFRLNFTSGMVFNPGSPVRFLLNSGPSCAEMDAYGYLVEM